MGAGLVGTGWVAGRQLAGKVVPAETTSSLGLEWRGRRGEGQSPARLYLATLLIPKQQDLPFFSLQLLDPDKHRHLHSKCWGLSPQGKMREALKHPRHLR